MKIEIKKKNDNPLMKRTDIKAVVMHEGKATPTRYEIIADLAKNLKAGKDTVVVNKIFGIKGLDRSDIKAAVYKDAKDIPKVLADKMKRRIKAPKKEEKPKEEAPAKKEEEPSAEEKKVEAPVEEKKEEAPQEKKSDAPTEEKSDTSAEEKPKEEPKEDKPQKEEKKE